MLGICAKAYLIVRPIRSAKRLSFSKSFRRARAAFPRAEGGVSALEFGFFAPIILFALISVADLAFAAYQRMAIDHILRAGAQRAMLDQSTDPTAPKVLETLRLMAAENFTLDSTTAINGKPPLIVSVSRYCVCPDNASGPSLNCSTVCPNSKPTLAYYTLSAESRSSSLILPSINFSPKLQVQVR